MRAILITAAALISISSQASANECTGPSFKTYLQVVECLNRTEAKRIGPRDQDLSKFLAQRRLTIARNIDKGLVPPAEGTAQIDAETIRVNTEVQKRDAIAAQVQAPQQIIVQQAQPKGMTFCHAGISMVMCY